MKGFWKLSGTALLITLLTGCSSGMYDSRMRGFVPDLPQDTYPIDVVSGAVKLRLPVVAGRLADAERRALRRLAEQARSLSGPIVITRPAGSVRAEVLAAHATRELVAAGISERRIVHRAGGPAGELVVSYRRKFAVTKECGNWSRPLNETAMNTTYPNFGCAQQFNLAAQVDNPEDFERPRVMTPPDSDARNNAMDKYRKGEDHTSQWPGGTKIKIDEGVKTSVSK